MSVFTTRKHWLFNAWVTALLCVALIVVGNRLARSRFQYRVDLSEDQLYAPSPVGRRLLGELDDVLSVRAYFTARSRLGPVQIAKRRLIDQLAEFEEAAGGRMELSYVDPNDSAEARAEALELGIQPIPMRAVQGTTQVTQDTWLGMCMRYRGRELVEDSDHAEHCAAIASAVMGPLALPGERLFGQARARVVRHSLLSE